MIQEFFQYAVRGLPLGCVFALLAVGLVLNFKTSGVFNLAFAAQAYASAAIYYVLRKQNQWQVFPAAIIAIVVFGTLIAVVLDRLMYRHQRTASSLAKLVTSLGLLIAIPQIVLLVVGSDTKVNPPPLWPVKRSDEFLWPKGSSFALDASQIATIVFTALVVIGLAILFSRSAIGLRMRAVVESPRLLQLQGVNAERVALGSWILSSLLASLAGVLIAPLFAQLNSLDFFTLLVAAIAATVAASLTSIPIAFAAGLGLGVLQAELAGFLPTDSVLATGLRPSLPFVVLFALLVFRRSIRTRRQASDPLAGVDPPPVPVVGHAHADAPISRNALIGCVVLFGGLAFALCTFVLDEFWLGLLAAGVCLAVVMLSIVLTTGVGRTISLCQGTFAAMGAFATAQLVQHDVPFIVCIFVGAAVAAVGAAILAIPIIRLPGIYAALATLAFALMFEGVLVPLDWVSGGSTPLKVPKPVLFGIHFTSNYAYLLFATFWLVVLGIGVIAIRRGMTGGFLDAVGGSPAGAASIGINATRHQFAVFVLGAAVAGFGGGLVAGYTGFANYQQSFTFFFSLVWVAIVVTMGSRKVLAAVVGGISFFILPELLTRLFNWPRNWVAANQRAPSGLKSVLNFVDPKWAAALSFILFGLGALTYAKHPEGVLDKPAQQVRRLVSRITNRGAGGATPPDDTASANGSGGPEPAFAGPSESIPAGTA